MSPRAGPATVAALLALAAACGGGISPISNKLKVGQEPYLIFVADGENGAGDLFASAGAGGRAFQVTFTRLDERSPALSPDGIQLAFLRYSDSTQGARVSVWVMNLVNGAERALVREGGIAARAVAWSRGGDTVYVRSPTETFAIPAPPASPRATRVDAPPHSPSDSLFHVWAGDPPVAEVASCGEGEDLCAFGAEATPQRLSRGHDPFRWGADSVAYFGPIGLEVRPLRGGVVRQVRWSLIQHPRQGTYFEGPAAR